MTIFPQFADSPLPVGDVTYDVNKPCVGLQEAAVSCPKSVFLLHPPQGPHPMKSIGIRDTMEGCLGVN
jgi:hypothetical protein